MITRFSKVICFLLFFPLNGMAQFFLPDTLTPFLDHPPRWVIKFAPLALFDVDNTIQAGAEMLLGTHRRHSLQGELGYGWQALNMYAYRRSDFDNFEVWRGRFEWRRYSGRYRASRQPHFATPPIGRYFAVETFYKQVSAVTTTAIGRECADGTCAYFERGTYPVSRTVWGIHAKFGRQFVLSMPGKNRLLLDVFWGLGFRYLTPYRFRRPPNEDIIRFTDFTIGRLTVREEGVRPSGTVGLKLGYVL
ncbi:hypothetical protein [Larkinella harenae]